MELRRAGWWDKHGQGQRIRLVSRSRSSGSEHKEYTVSCTITWAGGQDSATKTFKLFFDQNGHDQRLDGSRSIDNVNAPNWLDKRPNHWGAVVPGLGDDDVFYKAGMAPTGYFDFGLVKNGKKGIIYIGDAAAQSVDPRSAGQDYHYFPATQGIDTCATVVLHEKNHKEVMQACWGPEFAYNYDFDKDRDLLKDSWETANHQQPTAVTEADKYFICRRHNLPYLDSDIEHLANLAARKYRIGSLDAQDRSNIGKQAR